MTNNTKIRPGQAFRIGDSAISVTDVYPENRCVVGTTDTGLPIAASERSLGKEINIRSFWDRQQRRRRTR